MRKDASCRLALSDLVQRSLRVDIRFEKCKLSQIKSCYQVMISFQGRGDCMLGCIFGPWMFVCALSVSRCAVPAACLQARVAIIKTSPLLVPSSLPSILSQALPTCKHATTQYSKPFSTHVHNDLYIRVDAT